MSFLGVLLDTIKRKVAILVQKVQRAFELILGMIKKKKVTVLEIQRLCGFLNFLGRSIVPRRAFTKRFYTYYKSTMKPLHHINVSRDMKEDMHVWLSFLNQPDVYRRPFINF